MKTAFALLLVLSGTAYAQRTSSAEIGPRLAIELHDSHLVIGAEARFAVAQLAPTVRMDIRPEFNYYIYNDGHILDLSGELIFAFDVHSESAEPYADVGLGLFSSGCSGCDSVNRLGLNLGGGCKFLPHGTVQPFVEMRFTVGDIDPILLAGGVLFTL